MRFIDIFDLAVNGDVLGLAMILLVFAAALGLLGYAGRQLVRSRRTRTA